MSFKLFLTAFLLFFVFSYSFSQTGCRIANDDGSNIEIVYTNKVARTGVMCNGFPVDVYDRNSGGISAPAGCIYTPNLNPSPATRFRDCVVMTNPNTDALGNCGLATNYSLSCPVDDYAWVLLLMMAVLGYIVLKKPGLRKPVLSF